MEEIKAYRSMDGVIHATAERAEDADFLCVMKQIGRVMSPMGSVTGVSIMDWLARELDKSPALLECLTKALTAREKILTNRPVVSEQKAQETAHGPDKNTVAGAT